MTIDSETDLRRAMRDGSAGVAPPADLLDTVRRGGRRRLRRRRGALIAGVAALTALAVVGGALAHRAPPHKAPTVTIGGGEYLLTRPTRGDLAGNQRYLDTALATWRSGRAHSWLTGAGVYKHLLGQPHVAWAGNTPAGPAALVAQLEENPGPRNPDDDTEIRGRHVVVGYIGQKQGAPTLLSDNLFNRDGPVVYTPTAFLIGTKPAVLVALDTGQPTSYSTAITYGGNAPTRQWTPLTFSNGAAIVTLPSSADPHTVVAAHPPFRFMDQVGIGGDTLRSAGTAPMTDSKMLPWGDSAGAAPGIEVGLRIGQPPATDKMMSGQARTEFDHEVQTFSRTLHAGSYGSPNDPILSCLQGHWLAYGTTQDGRRVVAGELQYDNDPSRAFAMVTDRTGTTTVVDGGPLDAANPLPVRIHLPGGGWLVASYQKTLAYQRGTGATVPAGNTSAFLPEDTTRVWVNATTPVDLSHR